MTAQPGRGLSPQEQPASGTGSPRIINSVHGSLRSIDGKANASQREALKPAVSVKKIGDAGIPHLPRGRPQAERC